MKITILSLGIAILMATLASAASSYKVTLPSDLSAGDVPLKAGEYTVRLEGKQAVFKMGKESIEVPVVIEKNETKFQETSLELMGSKIHSIDIGGTNMKIMFRPAH